MPISINIPSIDYSNVNIHLFYSLAFEQLHLIHLFDSIILYFLFAIVYIHSIYVEDLIELNYCFEISIIIILAVLLIITITF